jgi:membrane fusion protein
MSSTLFRAEVRAALAAPRGTLLLAHSLPRTALASAFAALALAVLACLRWCSFTRVATVSGMLVPDSGVLQIVAAQNGVVTELSAQVGASFAAGAELCRIATPRSARGHGDANTEIAALLQARRDSLRADQQASAAQWSARDAAAGQRLRELTAQRRQIESQIVLQRQRLALAEAAERRFAALQSAGFVAVDQQQQRQADRLDQQQRLADLQRALSDADAGLAAAAGERRQAILQGGRERESIARDLAALEQTRTENQLAGEQRLLAPQAGSVAAVLVDPGQAVSAGQTLITLLPRDSQLEAELRVPSSAAGFLRVGMPVQLRYQAYPYQKFGVHSGRIREVSAAALSDASRGEPFFRLRVTLDRQAVHIDGADISLRPGATLEASIALEKRRLYEWLLDPLHSLAARG